MNLTLKPLSDTKSKLDFELLSVIKLIKNTKDFFEKSRSDEYFNQLLEDAKDFAAEIDSEIFDF